MPVNSRRCLRWLEGRIAAAYQLQFPIASFAAGMTRSRTISEPFTSPADVEELAVALLDPLFPVMKGIRLIGVTVSTLNEAAASSATDQQLSLL
ncbi:hypothetical protein [Bosea sp. F3-2]|uniref:DinB/UmuC family translesion DNA polymerase n=1 Tax=Bosea sp. F3-2 TaxID=2599640 RepID=UPI0020BE8F57|nr:hypothetical protein [Bosea sp. F3-2]